ncbi:Rv1733c family protein [Streptacidiphilus anmyonensis]|uniref:Rv1733c family protein n=1 Tax=Streptacidiphilus anmyonensis TaxID=405782 RepID=UPI0005A7274A|nr:hypothetical protein [Streptacidiphilus anmyonensis]
MAAPAADPRPSAPVPRRSRLARARARRRSALWRRSDRWRSALLKIQVLGLAATTVLCALLGMSFYQQGRADAQQEAQSMRPAQAHVVGRPYPSGVGGDLAQVSWTAPDGSTRQGVAGVPTADHAGDQVQIWLDGSGNVSTGPTSTANVVGTAAISALLVMVGADAVLISAGAVARSRLNRLDQEAWEKEWLLYEPLWSRRR